MTGFGIEIDDLARRLGSWPEDVVVYEMDVINADQVLLCGGVPTGVRKDGFPRWQKGGREYRAVATKAQYRAAVDPLAKTEAAQ